MFGKLSLIFLFFAIVQSGNVTNTTTFWESKLNHSLTFQTYAGYQQIHWYYPSGKSGMFYQLYGAQGANVRTPNPSTPLIIWLQGGPGASSQFGAHQQIGPIKINNGTPIQNPFAWNYFGHLLFIDSPLNVGFSFFGDRTGATQVNSTDQATNHLVNFLVNFYKSWPQLLQSPIYITGQSFGGHYVPVLARKLLTNTTLGNSTGKVAGIAVGDPWTDPINQINYYDTYLWSVGVIDRGFRDTCTWFQTNSIVNMYEGNYKQATAYFDFITNNDTTPQYYMGGISIFGFRNYKGLDQSFGAFLQTNKQKFGIDDSIKYISGSDQIYTAFQNDVTRSVARDLVQVIRRVKTMIYNGQEDVVVNTPGVLQFINSLNWQGISQWKRAPKQIWTINNQVTGWAKVSGNFWFVLVNKAGHMVPSDQPRSAFSMMGHFMNNEYDWKL